jgi:predicted PolB exonuclease-like 3'-5' exonuclease
LAGGTGTYPFLIGFGRFETEGIRLFQYFLPDYGREISAFLDMRCLFEDKNVLLSFNGKSFDFPLLRNRMIMNRMENPLASFAHLDLLHPARRLWRDVLPSCSLDIIEEEIFLFSRYQDIDGALIPQAYFDFLQTGNTAQIRQIIMHNQQDLISLGRLLFLMHQIENHHPLHGHSPSELLAMFDVAIDMSDLVRIATILKKLEHSRRKIPDHSLLKYSLLLKRLQKWDEALLIWHGFLERSSEILFVAEELAKYYEHRENDLKQAIEYTNRALQYMDLMSEISGQNERSAEARKKFMHRLWRLNAKLKIKS